MNRTTILITLTLLVCSTSALDATSADYESKIQAALDNYAVHSDVILQRAIKLGNDGIAETVEIDANGDILSSSSSAALYADFGLNAVNKALDRNKKVCDKKVDLYDTYKGAFKQLTAQNNNDDSTITYAQLEKWEDVADIIHELEDGEFLSLWKKATGSESQESEGQMKLSQFVTFNDILDKLLMARVDFMVLTKHTNKEEIPHDVLYNWPALSEDMPDTDFHNFWKEALGKDVLKGVMNYEQFLLFYELSSEWLERDINDVIEEEKERREDYNESLDDDEEEEDDGYDDTPNESRTRFHIADEDLPDDLKADLESEDEDIRIEAQTRRRLDPENWGEFSYWTLHAYFACEKMFSSPRSLWTDQQWREMRDFYHEFIEEDKKDGTYLTTRAYQLSEDEYDLTQNAIPFQSGEKGRGLQAVRDIQAGELVFKVTNNTIVFKYGHTWRKFLFAVNERFGDPGMTCDLHVWSWVQDLVDDGPMKVVMDLDSGSLLNEGRDIPGWDAPNVQCGKPDATRCDMDYFAFRDIKEGEELLIDYREFAFLDSWPAMGL